MNDENGIAEPASNGHAPERHFSRSPEIGELAKALSAAQGEIRNAPKDNNNPFFSSKYADLAGISDACRGPLAKHNLAVMQFPRAVEHAVEVETLLAHESGQWVSETLRLPAIMIDKQGREHFNAQTLGSAITYARRYALAAIVGVSPEDDDGNSAADSTNTSRDQAPPQTKKLDEAESEQLRGYVAELEEQVTDLDTINAALRQWYKRPKGVLKTACWDALKHHAANQGWSFSTKTNKFVPGKEQDVA